MNQGLIIVSIILYGIAATLPAFRLARSEHTSPSKLPAKKYSFWILGLCAVLAHGVLLYSSIVTEKSMNLGLFKTLSLVSWMMAALVLASSFRKPIEFLAIFLFPLAIATLAMDYFLVSERSMERAWQLQTHILASVAGYSFLSIAMLQALILVIQDHHLHNHRPGGLVAKLPPLKVMETFLFQLITLGFVLLTVGLLVGTLFIHSLFEQHLVHKTVLSLLAWSIFAVLLWGRWRFGWRGRKAIRWALGGFVLLMLAFVGTKFVLELALHRVS